MKQLVACSAVGFFALSVLSGQTVESVFSRNPIGEKAYPPPPRLAARVTIPSAVVLSDAKTTLPEELDSIIQWNAAGRLPTRNGFVRSTINSVAVFFDARNSSAKALGDFQGAGYVASTAHGVAWSGVIQVQGAFSLRLHLEHVSLPPGSTLWVFGAGGEAIAFDDSLVDDKHALWTPPVESETVHLEVEIPNGSGPASFVIREVAQIEPTTLVPHPTDSSCLIDAACVSTSTMPLINVLHGAIAHLSFIEGGSAYVCSGGLLNDRAGDFAPLLLTANHCFADQSAASSLVAYWDFIRSICNGSIPSRTSFPRSQGSTLLATSTNSDFTLVRLNSVPAGRWFLGWDPSASSLTTGLQLFRVSHPFPDEYATPLPQAYSTTILDNTTATCTSAPRPRFIYSRYNEGGTWGGSSGSPVVYVSGNSTRVVGQLNGRCYPMGVGDCDFRNQNIDGAFAQTYPSISQWLENGSPVQPSVCTPSSTTMCLNGNRFAVSATWRTHDANGAGTAVRLTDDTGYFWFFGSSNVEAVVKVLNACSSSSKFWVFAGGLTNVNVVLTVIDTKTGTTKTYTNPIDTAFQPIQDTSAFATCP